jgi:hypothetical protein
MAKKRSSSRSRRVRSDVAGQAGRGRRPPREITPRPIGELPRPPIGTWPPLGTWPPFGSWPPFGTWPPAGDWPPDFPARPLQKQGAGAPLWSVRPQWPRNLERWPQQWEYTLVEAHGARNLGDALGVMGRNGWEAVGIVLEQVNQYLVLLKRPANVRIPPRKKQSDSRSRTMSRR